MPSEIPPSLVLIFGAVLVPITRGWLRAVVILLLPIAAGAAFWDLPASSSSEMLMQGRRLVPIRLDLLAALFAGTFILASFVNGLYGLYERRALEHWAALSYAGAAVGAVLAGDLVTLLVFWELTTVFSVFLIWARGSRRAYAAGIRYLTLQVLSGLLLLVGVVAHIRATGSIAFTQLDPDEPGTWAILAGFGIKAGFPVVHAWLPDSYPEASPFGTIVLSVFTTKMAIYALARAFPGMQELVPIGAVMAVFASFYAFVAPDLRRALCYALIGQLGFMVAGIGIGTPLALNGVVAHAIASVFYQGLLFMGLGAVLYRTGTAQAAHLGGLFRSMPWTTVCTLIGAASIAALPPFSGFTTKTMILEAAHGYALFPWLALIFGAAAAVLHSGLRVPHAAFFGASKRPADAKPTQEAPWAMRAGMAVAALLCLAFGLFPEALQSNLPFRVPWHPYEPEHVAAELALIAGAAFAYLCAARLGLLFAASRTRLWDADRVYRSVAPAARALARPVQVADKWFRSFFLRRLERFIAVLYRHHGPRGVLARTWPTGSTVLWAVVILGLSLLLYAS